MAEAAGGRPAGRPHPRRQEAAAWLRDNLHMLLPGGRVLDVAAGRGRNAVFLAAHGWEVHAIDRDAEALAAARAAAPPAAGLTTAVVDLEIGTPALGHRSYDAVIVFNYLHRPLMPAIVDAVGEGGVLIYETFTTAQAARGRPTNPAFLLQPGELASIVAPLDVRRFREGEFDGRFVASVVAARM